MAEFNRILTGIAFSPTLKANVFETLRLGQFMNAKVVLVHVGEKTTEKEETLNGYIDHFSEIKQDITILWKTGDPVDTILKSCKETEADLLILGAAQRENIVRYYLGSIARKIVKKAPCSLMLLIKPSVDRKPCNHIVVNGLKHPKTQHTLQHSFQFAKDISANKITIVEEIAQSEVKIKVDDDDSLQRSTLLRKQIEEQEKSRVESILATIKDNLKENVSIKLQSIFGKRGYSIGHYAKLQRADLLIMNKPEKSSFLDKIFPQDIDYILDELPTDVLIIH